MSQFKMLDAALAPLIAAGLPLPEPMAQALKDEPQPLALSTRTAWPEWAAAHGYTAEQIAALMQSIGRLRSATGYLQALAADLSVRRDANGAVTEPVSDLDRHSAALMLHARALSRTALAGPGDGALRKAPGVRATPSRPEQAQSPSAATTPPAAAAAVVKATSREQTSNGRETIRLKQLTPEETERRKAALVAAGGK